MLPRPSTIQALPLSPASSPGVPSSSCHNCELHPLLKPGSASILDSSHPGPPHTQIPAEKSSSFLASVPQLPVRLHGCPLMPGPVDVSAPPASQHSQGDLGSISSQPEDACAPEGCTCMPPFLQQRSFPFLASRQPSRGRQDGALPHLGARHLSESHSFWACAMSHLLEPEFKKKKKLTLSSKARIL